MARNKFDVDETLETPFSLEHDPHLRAQRVQCNFGNIIPVNQHSAVINIVKAGYQIDNSTFSGTGRSYQRNAFTGFHIKAELL